MRRGLQPRDGGQGRVAVLALDLLSDFDFPDGPAVRRALGTRVRPLRQLLARARNARVPVIYANDNLGEWRSDSQALIAHCVQPRRPGATLVKSLVPEEQDSIVLKPRHSAFFGTPLVALLDDRDVDTLIITGVSAESCVWMTACDAHTRGFALVIPADTLAGASSKAVRRSLASLREVLGARVPRNASSLRFANKKLIA
jgi:nicotinamidase-related amidase